MAESTTVTISQPRGFFQDPLPANLILATFFVITIPLTLFISQQPTHLFIWIYIWLFGMTHFVLTFTIYLNRKNLSYFNQTWRNRVIYFILPIGVFLLFDLFHATHIEVTWQIFALYFLGGIRLLDFNHLNRQSFGVLQLFKAQQELTYQKNLKRIEMNYFNLLTIFMFLTYLAGGVSPLLQAGGPFTIAILGHKLFNPGLVAVAILQWFAVVLLILMLLGALPTWPHSKGWGYGPSGGLGLVLVILVILVLLGKI